MAYAGVGATMSYVVLSPDWRVPPISRPENLCPFCVPIRVIWLSTICACRLAHAMWTRVASIGVR